MLDFLLGSISARADAAHPRRVSRLRAVIDHLAKPEIASGRLTPWDELMRRVSEHAHVYCKLRHDHEADHERWVPADLFHSSATRDVLRAEAPMFGSDWQCARWRGRTTTS